MTTAFNAGELTPALAGRVDFEDYKYGARLIENFIPEIQGGLKKFYGTRHIATINKPNNFIMVPFDGADDPLVLIFHDGTVGCVYADTYYETGINVSLPDYTRLRWTQMNDIMFFAHPASAPFQIELLGVDRKTKQYVFNYAPTLFNDVPYFPVGWRGNYAGKVETNGAGKGGDYVTEVTVTAPTKDAQLVLSLPQTMIGMSGARNIMTQDGLVTNVLSAGTSAEHNGAYTVGDTRIELWESNLDGSGAHVFTHSGTTYSVSTGTNVEPLLLGDYNEIVVPGPARMASLSASSGGGTSTTSIIKPGASVRPGTGVGGGTSVSTTPAETTYARALYKTLSQEQVLNTIKGWFGQGRYSGSAIVIDDVDISIFSKNKKYALKLVQGASTSTDSKPYYTSNKGDVTYTVQTSYPAYESIGQYNQIATLQDEFLTTEIIGREVKFLIEDTNAGVMAWAENVSVSHNTIVFSDNSYYLAVGGDIEVITNGEVTGYKSANTGNVQPTHKSGKRSDGKVVWEYMHSGTATGTVVSVDSTKQMRVNVNGYLPVVSGVGKERYIFKAIQWGIFGYRDVYPSQVFFFKGRLGYFTATKGFGCWLSLSKSDDFFDFGTETFGANLDTDAIVSVMTGHADNNINWVLPGERLYCGSYSGEYNVAGQKDGPITPTNMHIVAISNLGGANVMAIKFRELNLFVGLLNNEIYSISYDYTQDDYVPTNIGFMSSHLLDERVRRWAALNNSDRNIYFLTDTKQLRVLNYVKELKRLGYYRVNLGGEILDFATSTSGAVSAGYVIVYRNGVCTIERMDSDSLGYMLDRREFSQEEPEDITIEDFAKQEVYLLDLDTYEFYLATADESGYIKNNRFKKFWVGLPMVCTLHGQPMAGEKLEGLQQKSIAFNIRLNQSGRFEYGTSHDFTKYTQYNGWNTQGGQEYGDGPNYMTGDIHLPTPSGYMQQANKAVGPYPNDTSVALNLRCHTPEPFNILMISNVYV